MPLRFIRPRFLFTTMVFAVVVGCPNGETNQRPEPRTTSGGSLGTRSYDGIAHENFDLPCYRPCSRWGRVKLTWRLVTPLEGLSLDGQLQAVRDAFAAWAVVTPLEFHERSTGVTDMELSFVRAEHGDAVSFDGPGTEEQNILAHGFLPDCPIGVQCGIERPCALLGDVHFCNAERWTLESGGMSGEIDLFTVALHEIGHALGLEHSPNRGDVMFPGYTFNVNRLQQALSNNDVDAIQRLYGSRDGTRLPLPVNPAGDFSACVPRGLGDFNDPDTDQDGIPDTIEYFALGTDWTRSDTDDDGFSDFEEVFRRGTPPTRNNKRSDREGDGVPNEDEGLLGTDSRSPDTDGDGLSDGRELFIGSDPLNPDTDRDCALDGVDSHPTNPRFGGTYCDDGNLCTDDFCDPETRECRNVSSCDDRSLCTTDSCNANTGECTNSSVNCDDDDPCTDNDCQGDVGCLNRPIVCDDGDPCSNDFCADGICDAVPVVCPPREICDPMTGDCVPGDCNNDVDCDDDDPCTIDACVERRCAYTDFACPDSFGCDPETGECVEICLVLDCDDGDPCTDDMCDPGIGTCVNSVKDCDDDNPCTDDFCNPDTGECARAPHCDDGNFCTSDVCSPEGICTNNLVVFCGPGRVCDPSNGTCVDQGCLNCFDDGQFCNGAEFCNDGQCDSTGNPCAAQKLICNEATDQCIVP